jgi:hypothetical protein
MRFTEQFLELARVELQCLLTFVATSKCRNRLGQPRTELMVMRVSPRSGNVYATDGTCLVRATVSNSEGIGDSFSVPRDALERALKLMRSTHITLQVECHRGSVKLRVVDMCLVIADLLTFTPNEDYPPVEQIIPVERTRLSGAVPFEARFLARTELIQKAAGADHVRLSLPDSEKSPLRIDAKCDGAHWTALVMPFNP